MDMHWIVFCSLTFLIRISKATNLNSGYTDALTLEEYEDDVELIKIRFDTTRPCRFFGK